MSKKIVIFADGTGNAFSAQESNVWRLFQALDQTDNDQIARYIPGVGTSGIKIWAAIDGATGLGVPSNVREFYRFICRNWEPGDEIYMFGFSRGAFTIRTLIGLIDSQGLVPSKRDGLPIARGELRRSALAAWRAYRAKTVPWRQSLPTIWLGRAIRDAWIGALNFITRQRSYPSIRAETVRQKRIDIPIKFVGLFDTVEAYGVPVEELRSTIDWMIWPISFRNHTLSSKVEVARHALSLDDERKTFHPVRFDLNTRASTSLAEVWFAGVHSDVGGGYPDPALSYVPLVWIADESQLVKAGADGTPIVTGLRFSPGALAGFRAVASAYGPTHDSREGFGLFYRYAPRTFKADKSGQGQIVVHHSVIRKMAFDSDAYVPVTLPDTASVLMPDGTISPLKRNQQDAADAGKTSLCAGMETTNAALDQVQSVRADLVERTQNLVWWRRVTYFLLIGWALLILILPKALGPGLDAINSGMDGIGPWRYVWGILRTIEGGVRALLYGVKGLLETFLPSYTTAWINVLLEHPLASVAIALIAYGIYRLNKALGFMITDCSRMAWNLGAQRTSERLHADAYPKDRLTLRFAKLMRTGALPLRIHHWVTRRLIPAFCAIGIVAGAAILLSLITVNYYSGEQGSMCAHSRRETTDLGDGKPHIAKTEFDARSLCWASGLKVEKGKTYTIWLDQTSPFRDATVMADIAGFDVSVLDSPIHLVGLPFRRWWSASWFQPIARINDEDDVEWPLKPLGGVEPMSLTTNADDDEPIFVRYTDTPEYKAWRRDAPSSPFPTARYPDDEERVADEITKTHRRRIQFVSQFVARDDGELFLFVNDIVAAFPGLRPTRYFYDNNRGKARVTIQEQLVPPTPQKEPPK